VPDDSPLGELIRQQRELQALTMRQLAELAGISKPYLSQIEHGLREPSERVLEALAENLELSADALREQTRRGQAEEGEDPPVVAAIKADRKLSARQRQTLIDIYDSFTAR
jgi:transcriptional regulator with XRE-family HTH domain